jgi:iron-sulfur cluster repair protein YtfE (RIC family)
MNQDRFNPFHQIHQALRAMLYHASLNLQQADCTNSADVETVVASIEEIIETFEAHANTEDRLVFPMIAAHAPEVVSSFEQQHVRDHELGEALADALQQFRAADSGATKTTAARRLQRALSGFTAFNLNHMNEEETIVLQLIHQHYSDQQLFAKQLEILASLSPEHKEQTGKWMLLGLTEKEIVMWYAGLKNSLPQPAFERFLQLAQRTLSADKFRRITENLVSVAA